MTVVRAVSWLGTAVVGWSLNVHWGSDAGLAPGPPHVFERQVTGAMLLCLIASIALSVSGRQGKAPHWSARLVAIVGAGIAIALAMMVHGKGEASVLSGPGWRWMVGGSVGVALAAVGTLALPGLRPQASAPKRSGNKQSKRSQRQRR